MQVSQVGGGAVSEQGEQAAAAFSRTSTRCWAGAWVPRAGPERPPWPFSAYPAAVPRAVVSRAVVSRVAGSGAAGCGAADSWAADSWAAASWAAVRAGPAGAGAGAAPLLAWVLVPGSAPLSAGSGAPGSDRGTCRVNVLPRPSALSAVMSPPSSVLTSRAIDSPSPVPP